MAQVIGHPIDVLLTCDLFFSARSTIEIAIAVAVPSHSLIYAKFMNIYEEYC